MKKLILTVLILSLMVAPYEALADQAIHDAAQDSVLLLQLKQKLAQAQYRYYLLQTNVEEASEGLIDVQETILTLEETLDGLEKSISITEKEIKSVKTQIERKKMDIRKVENEIKELEIQFEDQKLIVEDLMTLLYVKRGIFYDNEGVNAVKVLASEDSISQTLQEVTYLDLIEEENQNQIEKLDNLDKELKDQWTALRTKQDELSILDEELAGEISNLKAQKEGQENLLNETKGEEEIYKTMIESADEHEEEILKEIESYVQNVSLMESQLSGKLGELTEEQRAEIKKIEEEAMQNYNPEEIAKNLNLDWPVSPAKGLTAFFHDTGYATVFGVDHYALDIRANHGSPIYAPADGVVYNVIYDPTSNSYAYIMVAHRMGVMTLYGHVSEVAVKVGDYVSRGQILGATGATPGTVGSGYRTTGPHLHFEVWQDGVRVDPLQYMRLEEVPLDSLPESYVQQIKDKLEGQIKEIESVLNN